MLGAIVVLVLDHEPGVLIRLQPRERDTLQVVDVLIDLCIGRRVVDMPADDRAGVLVFAVDAVNEALDLQRVGATYPHASPLGAGRIMSSEQVLHCTLTAARCLPRFAPLEVHLARCRCRTRLKQFAKVLLDARQHTQNFDGVYGSAGQRATIGEARELVQVVPHAASCFYENRIDLPARKAPARRPHARDAHATRVDGLAEPITHAEPGARRLRPPGSSDAGGKTSAERDAQRFVARTEIDRGHGDSWFLRSGDRRGCKPLASYVVCALGR
jgi:hypothetical protein